MKYLRFPCSCRVLALASLSVLLPLSAAVPPVDPSELPRIPAVEVDRAIDTFQVKPGFRLEIAAAEPEVADPIALCFDENGRMFVVEMIGYSERRDDEVSRIRLLEDRDGDGYYETSTVFVDGLRWPTALFYYDGGLFVGDTPDLLYFKDTTGDGKADSREVIYTGFGTLNPPQNVQAMLNSLNWGLDNRIHGAGSRDGGLVVRADDPSAEPLDIRRRDFSFDPRTLEIRMESGGAQHGLTFDDWGRKFLASNSHHLRAVMYEARYAARNRAHVMPNPQVDIPDDGPAAEIYRISPDEPWRIVRTRMRIAERGADRMEGGGRISGYFSGASGVTIYRGDAWPAEYVGDAFITEIGSNLLHRKFIYPAEDGVGLRARRPEGEEKVEFLASEDIWFRPVDANNSPDGTFYLTDMYREVIEHPWSLPDPIKEHLDLNSGNDRGRIYRIVPENFQRRPAPRLGSASPAELVGYLDHANAWHRITASRLLYERQDRSAVRELDRLLREGSPLGRLHALYALQGLEALTEAHVLLGLEDDHEGVREHAVRLSEDFLGDDAVSEVLWAKLLALADDPGPRVRYQLAFTLGESSGAGRVEALASIVRQGLESRWMQAAVLSSLSEGAGEFFSQVSSGPDLTAGASGRQFLQDLAVVIGSQNRPADIRRVLDYLGRISDRNVAFGLLASLGTGLQRAGTNFAEIGAGPRLRGLIAQAAAVAEEPNQPERMRLEAVRLLGMTDPDMGIPFLLRLLQPGSPQSLQLAALNGLAGHDRPAVAREILQRWSSLTPRVKGEALATLLGRGDWAVTLLEAVLQGGAVRSSEISSTQLTFLMNHSDPRVRELAGKVSEELTSGSRQAVIDAYSEALTLPGDAARGREVYLNACASCHKFRGEGQELGPDLATVQNAGKEQLLVHTLDPNREVAPNYLFYLLETRGGQSLLGIVANETAASVTIKQPFGAETPVLRAEIARMESLGQSIMPEGLEGTISKQQMADLLEYIVSGE